MSGGGKSKSQQQQVQQTTTQQNPWAPAIPGLTSLASSATGLVPQAGQLSTAQSGALDTLQANASAGNPYEKQVGVLANDLLAGGTDRTGVAQQGYDQFRERLDPFARGDFVDPTKNPQLQAYLNIAADAAQNRVNGQFAAAGRDFSGANNIEVGRGVTEAMAPTLLNAYQGERANQLGAINSLYGGANQTTGILSGLDQTALGNRQAGIGVADAALGARDASAQRTLEIEAQRLGIPVSQLSQIAGILGPLGQMGGTGQSTSYGQSKGEYQMSPVQQAMGWTQVAQGVGPGVSSVGRGINQLSTWFGPRVA